MASDTACIFIVALFMACCMVLVAGLMLLWLTDKRTKPPEEFKEPECTGCSWKGNNVNTNDH